MRSHCSSNASTAYCLSFSQYARYPPRLRTAEARDLVSQDGLTLADDPCQASSR